MTDTGRGNTTGLELLGIPKEKETPQNLELWKHLRKAVFGTTTLSCLLHLLGVLWLVFKFGCNRVADDEVTTADDARNEFKGPVPKVVIVRIYESVQEPSKQRAPLFNLIRVAGAKVVNIVIYGRPQNA